MPDEVSEAALAHADKDRVRAAYLRTAFLEERRALMQAWADYLQGTQAVVALSETAVFAIEWRSPRARHEAKSAASNFR